MSEIQKHILFCVVMMSETYCFVITRPDPSFSISITFLDSCFSIWYVPNGFHSYYKVFMMSICTCPKLVSGLNTCMF